MHCYPFPRGQGRIIDRTGLGRLRFAADTLTVATSDGFSMRVMPNDLIGRHIYLTGQFDRTIPEVLLHFAQDGDCIFDIGANVGYVSCVLLAQLPRARVAAVEPLPACFALLEENLAAVGRERACAFNVALSDRSGTGHMTCEPGNTGGSHLDMDTCDRAGANSVAVQVSTADAIMTQSRFDRLDLVKIDVEGHEQSVLRSFLPVLKSHQPRAVLFECQRPADVVPAGAPIRTLLESAGYSIYGIEKRLTSWRLHAVKPQAHAGNPSHDYVALAPDAASRLAHKSKTL
ncbi:MAG: FkbM family methyltransferase [Candidatus Hydrogenedentes bacterium]|nr:FkbM family methyltransferase [Candidatus Hydrogenedentota bacterium]